MPIDNDIIQTKLKEITLEQVKINEKLNELRSIERRLSDVMLVKTPNPNNPKKAIMNIPLDKQTGEKYTPSRRQTVHDKAMADANAALV